MTDTDDTRVRTFLIADIRGYTRYTHQHGDEAAARLATRFAALVREVVEAHGGQLLEMRGDEALVVFASTRGALRAAVELQKRFVRVEGDEDVIPVGIGIDVGEAVPVDGGYRGSALNMAARLCGAAGPGETLVTQAVGHLAGKVEGVTLTDQGRRRFKGLEVPVTVLRAHSGEGEVLEPPAIVSHDVLLNEIKRRDIPFGDRTSLGRQLEQHTESFGNSIGDFVQRSLHESLRSAEENLASRSRGIPSSPPMPAQQPPSARDQLADVSTKLLMALMGIGVLIVLILAIWLVTRLF